MSFQRLMLAAVAAFGLSTAVLAEDTTTTTDTAPVASTTTVTENTTTTTTDATSEKVNLNKATAKELAKVKGITMVKARAIVAHRKKHGDFKSVNELKQVKGFKKMSDDTLKSLEDQLVAG
jgi:competence protein ComEA